MVESKLLSALDFNGCVAETVALLFMPGTFLTLLGPGAFLDALQRLSEVGHADFWEPGAVLVLQFSLDPGQIPDFAIQLGQRELCLGVIKAFRGGYEGLQESPGLGNFAQSKRQRVSIHGTSVFSFPEYGGAAPGQ